MQKWSGRSWIYMLGHQGDFEAEINCCNVQLSDCLETFMVSALHQVTVKGMWPDGHSGRIPNGITSAPRGVRKTERKPMEVS